MPRITAEMILRTFPMDYGPVKARVNQLCDLLDETREVRIATELGTNITLGITGRKSHGRKGGIYTEKGHWGNLPCGEAFIAPIAGSSAGVYVIDASHAGVGRLTEPLKITVENGFAVAFEGGSQAEALAEMLAAVGDPNAYNIAELGFGCNDKAGICGITLEDEKVLGTCHIALGNNIYFGGTVAVGVHVDGVMTRPTAWFDEQRIIENGELLI